MEMLIDGSLQVLHLRDCYALGLSKTLEDCVKRERSNSNILTHTCMFLLRKWWNITSQLYYFLLQHSSDKRSERGMPIQALIMNVIHIQCTIKHTIVLRWGLVKWRNRHLGLVFLFWPCIYACEQLGAIKPSSSSPELPWKLPLLLVWVKYKYAEME